jgi:hypothetical protein
METGTASTLVTAPTPSPAPGRETALSHSCESVHTAYLTQRRNTRDILVQMW